MHQVALRSKRILLLSFITAPMLEDASHERTLRKG